MKYLTVLFALLTLTACTGVQADPTQSPAQDRLVQPGPASAPGYWDALDNVPGARTGEADYYYSHRGGGTSF